MTARPKRASSAAGAWYVLQELRLPELDVQRDEFEVAWGKSDLGRVVSLFDPNVREVEGPRLQAWQLLMATKVVHWSTFKVRFSRMGHTQTSIDLKTIMKVYKISQRAEGKLMGEIKPGLVSYQI